jgi:hypothetical protein
LSRVWGSRKVLSAVSSAKEAMPLVVRRMKPHDKLSFNDYAGGLAPRHFFLIFVWQEE